MIAISAADQRPSRIAPPDRPSRPDRIWNRIPEAIRCQIVDLALDQPELSPRELAVRFTDEEKYFVSEASVYRLLKAHDLITSPAYIVIKAAEEFTFEKINPSDLTWLCFAKILASVAYAPCGSLAEPTRAAFTELCLGAGMACWALAFRGLGEDLCAKMQVL
jgi:hypothetical protein